MPTEGMKRGICFIFFVLGLLLAAILNSKKNSIESGFEGKAEVILKSALQDRPQDSSSDDEDNSGKIF